MTEIKCVVDLKIYKDDSHDDDNMHGNCWEVSSTEIQLWSIQLHKFLK